MSAEELRTVVAEAGVMVPRRHQRMLLSILDLDAITVDDIMVPRQEIIGLDLDRSWEDNLAIIQTSPHDRLPVYREYIDNIIGVTRIRDLLPELARGELTQALLLERIREPYFVPEGTPLNKQLLELPAASPPLGVRRRRVRRRAGADHDARHRQRARRRARQRLERRRRRRDEGERPQLRRRRERERAAAESRDELEFADRRPEDVERSHRRAARDDSRDRHGRDRRRTIRSRSSTRASTASRRVRVFAPGSAPAESSRLSAALLSRVHDRERLAQPIDGHHFDSERAPRRVRARHERAFEPVLLRLGEPFFAERHRPHLAREPELAEHDEIRATRDARAELETTASATARSAAVSPTRNPPTMFANTSLSPEANPQCRCRIASSKPEPLRVEALRQPPRRLRLRSIDERLNLDEHGPRAFARHERDAAGNRRAMTREEDRRRILDFAESVLAHHEEAHLVRRAETVLDGAHDAEAAADDRFRNTARYRPCARARAVPRACPPS